MARICNVPFDFIFHRGLGIRICGLLLKKCSENNFLIADRFVTDSGDYEGGFVQDPIRGYYEQPIIVLDFESLYPNCMIDMNMSNETCLDESSVGPEVYKKLKDEGAINSICVSDQKQY